MTDDITVPDGKDEVKTNTGKLILSPTRTYAPVVKAILENHFESVAGLIHSSGGGQTKCMKYMPEGVKVVKDNLFAPPKIFQLIQQSSGADNREMYQVFNMGCRLEVYTDENSAESIISTVKSFGIDAQVIGRVEAGERTELALHLDGQITSYAF
jgi:phosphoribosylformylglycinamidine cyclo-ligase